MMYDELDYFYQEVVEKEHFTETHELNSLHFNIVSSVLLCYIIVGSTMFRVGELWEVEFFLNGSGFILRALY